MSPLTRWLRFNLVGLLGTALQLATLHTLNHLWHGHYLLATTPALELTLLHNFLWHWHYTWHDRRHTTSPGHALLRFHLTNGLTSLIGNLALMRLFVHTLHTPIVLANLLAITACSLANFLFSHLWSFSERNTGSERNTDTRVPDSCAASSRMGGKATELTLLFLVAAMTALPIQAQTEPQIMTLPTAPSTRPVGYDDPATRSYYTHAGVLCGLGATTSPLSTKPTFGCGAGITLPPLPVFVEVGIMGPQANRSYLSGYLSTDLSVPLTTKAYKAQPMVLIGYSRLFETGHALDYGIALATPRFTNPKDQTSSLRIELRDYWTFANPTQHNVMLRLGWMIQSTD